MAPTEQVEMQTPLVNEGCISEQLDEIDNVLERQQISTGICILTRKKAQLQMEEEERYEEEGSQQTKNEKK